MPGHSEKKFHKKANRVHPGCNGPVSVLGVKLPNDWYLRLAGAAAQMLRGEIPLSQIILIQLEAPVVPTLNPASPPP